MRITTEAKGDNIMTIEERIRTCMLIEKMCEQKEYSERLGLENRSRIKRKSIEEREEQ